MSLFGRQKTPQEILKENKRDLNRNKRDLDKELLVLDREEKKIILEIKRLAKLGQNANAKTMAKELIRLRGQRDKIYAMKGQLSGVQSRTTTMQASATIAKSMHGATKAMAYSNAAMPMQQMQRTMMEFEKQNEISSMKEEMMDSILDGDDEEEELVDEEMSAVLDSIGLETASMIPNAPGRNPMGVRQKQPASAQDLDFAL
eukprot:TRINITY_DN8580_c0_g1_i1.p1 TRINITY_DN8580_c0_g1~~TRINITY_DN8580_c0_g1_i1.p1  ORF type:complete len:202 (+),score=71.20 TRINITY_DN8580_c0_g1_i1:31-636(+)